MNMNIAQLFDNLSFKLKDQFFLDKNNAENDKLCVIKYKQIITYQYKGAFIQIERNKESLMDFEISSI